VYNVEVPDPLTVQLPPAVAALVTCMLLCCAKTAEERRTKEIKR